MAVCPQCGAATGPIVAATPAGTPPPVIAPATTGLPENVAGLLCYLLGWLTGIIFLLIDKRPFVRFHAAQSIVVFGTLTILRIVITYGLVEGMFGMHSLGLLGLWSMLSLLIGLLTLILWILLMVTAFQGKRFEVPIAAPFAKSLAGSSKI
ncbi:MAG: DUF4870 domain-containing protein [Acidobacteriaceae bacterium]